MLNTTIERLCATMNSLELTTAITALANAISLRLTVEELSLLAGIFVQLGDTLATIAAQKALCEVRKWRVWDAYRRWYAC